MSLPKIGKPDGGVFSGLKAKLGFDDAPQAYSDDGREYYEDEQPDYGEYSYDYDENDASYQNGYYDDGGYSSPGYRSQQRAENASGYGRGISAPNLITHEDVRAYARIPESLNRDPLPPRRIPESVSARELVSNTRNESAYNEEYASDGSRSAGLDSLFSPTSTGQAASSAAYASEERVQGASYGYSSDSPRAAAASAPRSITLIRPNSYEQAEDIAKALKAGNAVVLSLLNTQEALGKRLLDFAFGVASALDARVECIGNKVFALTLESKLSEAERAELHRQGVIS